MEKYCRIDLSKTNFQLLQNALVLSLQERSMLLLTMKDIYKQYCEYKKFTSVMPLFDSILIDKSNEIIGYFEDNKMQAFSIIKIHDAQNAESIQFAWNYKNPKYKYGIKSIEHECAFYKKRLFKYFYLGLVQDYKTKIQGYEEVGKL